MLHLGKDPFLIFSSKIILSARLFFHLCGGTNNTFLLMFSKAIFPVYKNKETLVWHISDFLKSCLTLSFTVCEKPGGPTK